METMKERCDRLIREGEQFIADAQRANRLRPGTVTDFDLAASLRAKL